MYFITGTDTDIGKTFISSILLKKLNGIYFKPIQAGDLEKGGDIQTVKKLTKMGDEHFIPTIYNLSAPISPHEAARKDNITINISTILDSINKVPPDKKLIIEGAGGVMVPINQNEMIIDLIQKVRAEVIIVSSLSLGTFNHTFLTIEALKSRNIKIKGIVFNGNGDFNYVKNTIVKFCNINILGHIPKIDDGYISNYLEYIYI